MLNNTLYELPNFNLIGDINFNKYQVFFIDDMCVL